MGLISKNKQKRNRFNTIVINTLIEKHGYTGRFIRQSLTGERTSLAAEAICREYKELVKKVNKALDSTGKDGAGGGFFRKT